MCRGAGDLEPFRCPPQRPETQRQAAFPDWPGWYNYHRPHTAIGATPQPAAPPTSPNNTARPCQASAGVPEPHGLRDDPPTAGGPPRAGSRCTPGGAACPGDRPRRCDGSASGAVGPVPGPGRGRRGAGGGVRFAPGGRVAEGELSHRGGAGDPWLCRAVGGCPGRRHQNSDRQTGQHVCRPGTIVAGVGDQQDVRLPGLPVTPLIRRSTTSRTGRPSLLPHHRPAGRTTSIQRMRCGHVRASGAAHR
ncbi:hypothetical protein FB470_006728 [Amycolatopsis thermophila]|uniref:Transposase n=1 Tax=Amycolatopsis thermophila TaxID=206084 RepID=A0ABU0F5X5_9PSEU|nr:hypothetical protein [Amycolatopsis thermophila]